jgi:hypothetical protein
MEDKIMTTKEQLKHIKEILKMMESYIQVLQELVEKDDVLEETTTNQYINKIEENNDTTTSAFYWKNAGDK